MDKELTLKIDPKDTDYEEYISAYFQSGGLFVERSVIHREKREILELDIILTDFNGTSVRKYLVEIKSGKWGFSDIFKVRGWLTYLNFTNGLFIVKKDEDYMGYLQEKAKGLSIDLIHNSDLEKTNELLSGFLLTTPSEEVLESLRFSYRVEREMLKNLKKLKKENPEISTFIDLDDYFFHVNSSSFFLSDPVERITKIFETFLKYRNITARLDHELETGKVHINATSLKQSSFEKVFYSCEDSPLHIAMYVEHLARVTIIKSCTLYLLTNSDSSFESVIKLIDIPGTIQNGLQQISSEPYFHRYPIFWQFYTYVMGGFILTDFKKEEYKHISENTGIPVDQIPNAFDSFNKLFPKKGGWSKNLPNNNIIMHTFFPLTLSGIGANHRRFIYVEKDEDGKKDFDELEKQLEGVYTYNSLIKWNNLGYRLLKDVGI